MGFCSRFSFISGKGLMGLTFAGLDVSCRYGELSLLELREAVGTEERQLT
jgi:hypothetical protein